MISIPSGLLRTLILLTTLLLPQWTVLAADADSAAVSSDIDPAKVEGLVKTLEDPEARAKLIDQLKTLTAAEAKSDDSQNVDELGLGFVDLVTRQIDMLARASVELSSTIVDLPDLTDWLFEQATDPTLRDYWIDLLVKLAVTLGGSIIGYRITRRFMNPTIDRFYAMSVQMDWSPRFRWPCCAAPFA